MISLKDRERLTTYLALLMMQPGELSDIRLVRAALSMQAHFVLMGIVQEAKQAGVLDQLKIGLIGCGMIGKLLLNNILVLTKQNLKISNVIVSTRRPEDLRGYSELGVSCMFDNDLCVSQADLLIFCTPDTLDNWIYTSLSQQLARRQAQAGRPFPLRVLHCSQRLTSEQFESIVGLPSAVIKLNAPVQLIKNERALELASNADLDPSASKHTELEQLVFEHSKETAADTVRVMGLPKEGLQELWMKRQRMWRISYYNYRM